MAIQILSDLHLESPEGYDLFDITPQAPYLALLGDIGNVVSHKSQFFSFLHKQVNQFEIVFFVPGNHEAYHSSWTRTLDELNRFAEDTCGDPAHGRFVLLNRQSFQIPNTSTVLLGCSLFSNIQPKDAMAVEMGLQDFYQIDDWDVNKHRESHIQDLAWLNSEVAMFETSFQDVKIMIFTHWSPSQDPRANDPRHAGSPITSGFVTDLQKEACFQSKQVKVWAFGHTHFNCDIHIARGDDDSDPLRLVSNQRGYYFAQAKGFDPGKTIMITSTVYH